MEVGRWDEANRAKVQLEELQRHRRRQMAATLAAQSLNSNKQDGLNNIHNKSDSSITEECYNTQPSPSVSNFLDVVDSQHKPLWFTKEIDQITMKETYIFTGKYWEQKLTNDWSMCPQIY
nr:SJCHGC05787 protein [Schistosoma japonicum]